MTIQGKPDVKDFLEAGVDREKNYSLLKDKINRRQKHVNLPADMLIRIKKRALKETEEKGYRVTETDVVEKAISEYLKMRK